MTTQVKYVSMLFETTGCYEDASILSNVEKSHHPSNVFWLSKFIPVEHVEYGQISYGLLFYGAAVGPEAVYREGWVGIRTTIGMGT